MLLRDSSGQAKTFEQRGKVDARSFVRVCVCVFSVLGFSELVGLELTLASVLK